MGTLIVACTLPASPRKEQNTTREAERADAGGPASPTGWAPSTAGTHAAGFPSTSAGGARLGTAPWGALLAAPRESMGRGARRRTLARPRCRLHAGRPPPIARGPRAVPGQRAQQRPGTAEPGRNPPGKERRRPARREGGPMSVAACRATRNGRPAAGWNPVGPSVGVAPLSSRRRQEPRV